MEQYSTLPGFSNLSTSDKVYLLFYDKLSDSSDSSFLTDKDHFSTRVSHKLIEFVYDNNLQDIITFNWGLLTTKSIDRDYIIKNRNKYPWDFRLMFLHLFTDDEFYKPSIGNLYLDYENLLDFIDDNIDMPWNFRFISSLGTLTVEFYIKHSEKDWNYSTLSMNPIFKPIIKQYNDKPWNLHDIVKMYKDEHYKSAMSDTNYVTELTDTLLSLPFDYLFNSDLDYSQSIPGVTFHGGHVCRATTIPRIISQIVPLSYIEEHVDEIKPHFELSFFNLLSRFDCLTLEFVEQYIHKPWNFNYLSGHSFVTVEFLERHIDKSWDFTVLSQHPNMTFEFINKYKDKNWYLNALSVNQFEKDEKCTRFVKVSPLQRKLLDNLNHVSYLPPNWSGNDFARSFFVRDEIPMCIKSRGGALYNENLPVEFFKY